mmetsp:Transcript_41868/g.90750  ORF Transcript_41868/g.90750 Transcript_41868/m.90750 type:complete len:152 (+) Transcript_41868:95-550(+)
MGLTGSHLRFQDVSPWTSEIIVKNQMQTPALILEAKHHHRPSPEKVVEHRVLPGEHVIVSGRLQEPRATFYIRTGQASAMEVKAPHLARLVITNDPHGLRVESQDEEVSISDLEKDVAMMIPGSDTVPMLLRNEHFKDVRPKSERFAVGGA